MKRRRRIILRHADCGGELVKGHNGLWTCRTCRGQVEIGENSTALLVGDGIRRVSGEKRTEISNGWRS